MLSYYELTQSITSWIGDNSSISYGKSTNAGMTVTLLLTLTRSDDTPISDNFSDALEIALKMDNKSFKFLAQASRLVVQTLNSKVQNRKKQPLMFDIAESVKQAEALLGYIGLDTTFGAIKKIIVSACCNDHFVVEDTNLIPLREYHVTTQLRTIVNEYLSDLTIDPFVDSFPTYLYKYSINIKIAILSQLNNYADYFTKKSFVNYIYQYELILSLSETSTPEEIDVIQILLLLEENSFNDNIKIDNSIVQHLVSISQYGILWALSKHNKLNNENTDDFLLGVFSEYKTELSVDFEKVLEKSQSDSLSSIPSLSTISSDTTKSSSIGVISSPEEFKEIIDKENLPPFSPNTSGIQKKFNSQALTCINETDIFLSPDENRNVNNAQLFKKENPFSYSLFGNCKSPSPNKRSAPKTPETIKRTKMNSVSPFSVKN